MSLSIKFPFSAFFHRWKRVLSSGVATLAVFFLLAFTFGLSSARAAGNVTDCSTFGPGAGTLQTALAGGGAISFSCSGTIVVPATITIAATTILNASGQNITLSGNSTIRLFYINSGISFTLQNLSVANGRVTSGDGGALYNNAGIVLINNVVFQNNQIFNPGPGFNTGGAIYNLNGAVTINNSTFINNGVSGANNSSGTGGAINTGGLNSTMTVNSSTFSGNSVSTGASSFGGGIYIGGGRLNVNNSTFSGNSANTGGGGLANFGSNVTVSNSTFSGNSTNTTGGGIAHLGGTMLVTNSTVSGNSATTGGGFYSFNLNNPLTIRNTIIANNLSGGNCSGPLVDAGNNLQFPANSCGATILTADPLLGALANNGGPTQTLALASNSPAIDAANPAFCPANDQRGLSRSNNCDIGAFEFVLPAVPVPTPTPADLIVWLRETPDRIADNSPENLITFTYRLKNVGAGTASALRIEFPIDPQLVIGFAQSDNPQVWVSSVSTKTVTITLPSLDKNQEVNGTLTFRPASNPSPSPGTKLFLRYVVSYDDPVNNGKKQLSNAVAFTFGEPGSNWDVSGGAIQLMETANPTVSTGSKVTFICNCYIPDETVNVWLTNSDGTSVALGSGTADKNGLFSIIVNTDGLPTGTYVVAVFGNRSEITGSGVLIIT